MIRRSARNDPTAGCKKLSDIIDKTLKNEERDNWLEQERLRKASIRQEEVFKPPWEGLDSQEIIRILKDALWKACGDDEESVKSYIESVR